MIVVKYSIPSSYLPLEIPYICALENTLITVCISSLTVAGLEVRRYSVTQKMTTVSFYLACIKEPKVQLAFSKMQNS